MEQFITIMISKIFNTNKIKQIAALKTHLVLNLMMFAFSYKTGMNQI